MAEARVTIRVTPQAIPWQFTKLFTDSIHTEQTKCSGAAGDTQPHHELQNKHRNLCTSMELSLPLLPYPLFPSNLDSLYPTSKSCPEPFSLPGVKIQTTSALLIMPKPCLSITGESASQLGPLQNPGGHLQIILLSTQMPTSAHLLQLWKELQPWTGMKTFIDISNIQGLEVSKFAFQPYYPFFHLCIFPLMTSSGKTL